MIWVKKILWFIFSIFPCGKVFQCKNGLAFVCKSLNQKLWLNLPSDVANVVARQRVVGGNVAGCRLVHECRRCVAQPQIVVENIYDVECDKISHVKNCRPKSRTVPFEKDVKICHHATEKICDTPCFSCPEFCQPNKQFWCEDDPEVRSDDNNTKICFSSSSHFCS